MPSAEFALNDAQQEATRLLEGRALVIAGAGTGKTRVIEARTAALLEAGVEPKQILLMTFTRKAAYDMLRRTAERHPKARSVDGGTFHHVAFRIVQQQHRALGFERPPTVIDGDDAANAIAAVAQRLGLGSDKRRRLPRKQSLQRAFSSATNLHVPLATVVERDLPEFVEELETLQQLRRAWVRYKVDRGYVDFDDVLVMAVTLLREAELRRRIARRWRYLLVDEYQDVNLWQAEMAELLAAEHGNLMVVGDPKQSIYGFRGARFEKITGFAEGAPQTQVVYLTDNYRSSQAILDLANAVMAQMRGDLGRPLRAAQRPGGERPELIAVEDDAAAADLIADQLQAVLEEPDAFAKHAVLVRNAYQSVPLQGELLRRRIPFEVVGGLRFTEAAHIKDVLAVLRVAVNPFDELAWLRLLQLLPGVGEVSATRAFADFADPDAMAATGEADPIARALRRAANALPPKARAPGGELIAALAEAQRAAQSGAGALKPFEVATRWYAPVLAQRYPGENYRVQDLAFFRVVVERYAELDALLADLTLDPNVTRQAEGGPSSTTEGLRPLTISTIHSAKGLEWSDVTLLGLDDRTLPSPWAAQREREDDDAALEEEKRLLYVAVTRAAERLRIVHVLFGRKGMHRISRFLETPQVQAALQQHEGSAERSDSETDAPKRRRNSLLDALSGDDL